MDMRKVVLVALLSLAVLFLSTIGSNWTGYTVLAQQDITLNHYPYPFIKNNNYNSLYIILPDQSTLDEQQAASGLAKSLQSTRSLPPKIVSVSEFKFLPEARHNLILLGDACTNELINELLSPRTCTLNLKEGQGLLKLVNYDRTSTLIVAGYDTNSMRKAVNVLANYGTFPLKGKQVLVEGALPNIYTYYLTFLN